MNHPIRLTCVLLLLATGLAAAQEVEFTTMSFNVRIGLDVAPNRNWPSRRDLVFEAIRKEAPDVLAIQEDLLFQAREIEAALGDGYDAVGRGAFTEHVGEFNSVLFRTDRFRLVESGVFWLSPTPDVQASYPWGYPFPRTVVWCLLECLDEGARGRRIRVYNTHFPHNHHEAREKCADLLARRIESDRATGPAEVLVLGDFNASSDTEPFRMLVGERTELADAFAIAAERGADHGTYHNFDGKPRWARIDHILVSKGIRVARAAIQSEPIQGRYASDHFPIVARIALR